MPNMYLTPPNDTWYIDTGASSHIVASQCNLSSYSNLSHLNQKLFIGSKQGIPIQGSGHRTVSAYHKHNPLNITHVLHTPQIVKKIIFVTTSIMCLFLLTHLAFRLVTFKREFHS